MRISSEKKQIKAEKGINFPDTELDVSPLTEFDKACIPFICENADIVGYSFVRNPSDIVFLDSIIKQTGKKHPLYVFKIESLKYLVITQFTENKAKNTTNEIGIFIIQNIEVPFRK